VAWNRRTSSYPPREESALDWSLTAMLETVDRLPRVKAWDGARAIAVISEAVWWVTIVDATMVRYHPDTYDRVLASAPPADRTATEETLGGLRFVRNHMGQDIDLVALISAAPRHRNGGRDRITDWTWRRVAPPALHTLSTRAQPWELDRYHAYQGSLADRAVGEAFSRARGFLVEAAAAASPAKLRVPAPS
jgi:hypothetical protein